MATTALPRHFTIFSSYRFRSGNASTVAFLTCFARDFRAASLEREVHDALMLVKRLGPGVREGKRRQLYWKLLLEVKQELMDALILATKDGDWSRLHAVSGLETRIGDEDKNLKKLNMKRKRRNFVGLFEVFMKFKNAIMSMRRMSKK
ncbi:uncharacterized protein LOC110655846 [Hevea brasiliensis]|uniref:uncharacterized protein LOC110655846 n=1 Tax=Hevea brasiliensis TaxID=3981 RepID=UPI0025FCE1E9|nr:uncharacterized protein LOC110655846 [Hevea brasiliensis]